MSIPLHIQENIACTFNALEATKSFGWKIEFALLGIIENWEFLAALRISSKKEFVKNLLSCLVIPTILQRNEKL